MSITPSQNGNFQVKTNEIIFCEGQSTESVNLLLQGKIDVFTSLLDDCDELYEDDILKQSFKIYSLNQNIFLGANDFFGTGKYTFSFCAAEDAIIHSILTKNKDQVKALMTSKYDYGAYIIDSISAFINHSYSAYLKLENIEDTLNIIRDNLCLFFCLLKEKHHFSFIPSSTCLRSGNERLGKLRNANFNFPVELDDSFFKNNYLSNFEQEEALSDLALLSKIDYYTHLSNIPVESRKSFFSTDMVITGYHCEDASEILSKLQNKIKDTLKSTVKQMKRLYSIEGESIFTDYFNLINHLNENNIDATSAFSALNLLANTVKNIDSAFETEYRYTSGIDASYINHMQLHAEKTSKHSQERGSVTGKISAELYEAPESLPEDLKNSARKILTYSNIPRESADAFLANLEAFRILKENRNAEDELINIKANLTSAFFGVYESVFKRVLVEKNNSPLLHMFLNFAYMDENLLSLEHTLTLYKLAQRPPNGNYGPVYTMKDWLINIITLKKDPSINKFGLDYFEVFREMKKRGEVTDKDKLKYDHNISERLKHEIYNLLKINQKVCCGQLSLYFPILYDEMIISRDLSKTIVTYEKINERLQKILEVDFSAFHREISFIDPQKGIEKELIMKAILPEFILIPTFGPRAVMWQELTGKKRDTAGRFLIPIFTTANLDDILIKLIGNFRWELSRTMAGVAWYDVTQKSLTSEYNDYIQFYKKNRDLSDDAKEKVRIQILKYRNSLRDMFTSDYEIWMNFESKGAMRLNKTVRSILYKYCPFSIPIREQLEKQPQYTDIALQFKNIRAKYAKVLEGHYRKLAKENNITDPNFDENLKFYRDL